MTAQSVMDQLVWDASRDRVGKVVGRECGLFLLRSLGGGEEWEASLGDLANVSLTDAPKGGGSK